MLREKHFANLIFDNTKINLEKTKTTNKQIIRKRCIPASPGPSAKIKITENMPFERPRFTWEANERMSTTEGGSSNVHLFVICR